MDHKEQIAAANALVEWFNTQEVKPSDAVLVMSKVIAKIIVGTLAGPQTTPDVRKVLDGAIDSIMLQLVHDTNDRLFHARRR